MREMRIVKSVGLQLQRHGNQHQQRQPRQRNQEKGAGRS